METQHWLGEALDCGYISPADAAQLNSSLKEVGRMLGSMMQKADSFCGPFDGALHEGMTEYFEDRSLITDD